MDIDKLTGLPEIPEGHWWEVRPFSRTHYYPYDFGFTEVEDGYEVCLLTKVTVAARMTRGDRWWELSKYTPEHLVDKVLFRKQITDPELYRKWATSSSLFSRHNIGKVFIEPADVLRVAKDIVDMMSQAVDRAARLEVSEGLVGVYPPKVLEPAA